MEPISAAKPTKEEKREKQRATNLLRAAKMHQARLELETDLLTRTAVKTTPLPTLNIGCSGWFYWDWKGTFYPEDLPTSAWFQHYRSHFGTVELNAPFYGWPTVATVKSWAKQAETQGEEQPFVYTIKVSELITHIHRMKNVKELIRDFGHIADLLGPRFGCFLYQFPASYTYTAERLEDILSQLDHTRRNVVEFRHAGWWNDTVYKAFEKTGTIFCACSAPKLPDTLVKTAPDIYLRLHGPEKWYRYNYSDTELARWAKAIAESKAKRVWVYFNNDYDAYAIHNAAALRSMLEGHFPEAILTPEAENPISSVRGNRQSATEVTTQVNNDSTLTINHQKAHTMSSSVTTLSDLFEEQLKDVYYAEKAILKALPKMAKKASSSTLSDAFNTHFEQTQGHVERLEEVFALIDVKAKGKQCPAIDGIIEEASELMKEVEDASVRDAAMLAAAQAVEHYEMSRYGTLVAWAETLGNSKAAKILQKTLDEETRTDSLLTQLAGKEINRAANTGTQESSSGKSTTSGSKKAA